MRVGIITVAPEQAQRISDSLIETEETENCPYSASTMIGASASTIFTSLMGKTLKGKTSTAAEFGPKAPSTCISKTNDFQGSARLLCGICSHSSSVAKRTLADLTRISALILRRHIESVARITPSESGSISDSLTIVPVKAGSMATNCRQGDKGSLSSRALTLGSMATLSKGKY